MGSVIMRKGEGPKSGGVTCSVDGRDGMEGCGGNKRAEGCLFFFLSPFIFCQESAGLGVDCGRADRCEFL